LSSLYRVARIFICHEDWRKYFPKLFHLGHRVPIAPGGRRRFMVGGNGVEFVVDQAGNGLLD
jgi:hypothetical protein